MNDPSGLPFAFAKGPLAKRIRERKRPLQSRSQQTVGAIVEATLQVLIAGGIRGLNTTKVAARAGVSIGTLYQYFPDKASLIAAVQADYAAKSTQALRDAVAESKGGTLAEVMGHLIDKALRNKADNLTAVVGLHETQMEMWMRENSGEWLTIVRDALKHMVAKPSRIPILLHALEGVMGSAALTQPKQLGSPAFAREVKLLAMSYLEA